MNACRYFNVLLIAFQNILLQTFASAFILFTFTHSKGVIP